MKREISLVKNTLILGFGTILPKIVNIITLPILTGYLSKSEYGTYDFIITIVALFLPTITFQVQTACFRFLLDCKYKNDEKRIIISTISCFIGIISFFALIVVFFALNKYSIIYRVLVVLYFLMDILLNLGQQIARGTHNNKIYSISSICLSLFTMIFIVLFVRLMNYGLEGALLSMDIAMLISIVFIFFELRLWEYIRIKYFSVKKLKEMLKYSWPMVPNSLSNWVMNLSDRLVITGVLGFEANAVYSISNKIPNLFMSLQSTFVMAWQENATLATKDEDIAYYYTKMFDAVFRIYFSIMAFLIAFSPLLFKLLIRGDYIEAYYQMPILFIGLLFSAIASFIGGIYVATKNTKSIGVTTIVSAIINILVNVMLIRFIGIFAGSISTLISYVVLALYRMKNIRNIINIKYNIRNMLFMIIILCLMSVLCYKRFLLFDILNVIIAIVFSILYNINVLKILYSRFINHNK